MSSIDSVSSSSTTASLSQMSATHRRHRPDADKMAADLFSQLDTTGKGYIEQSDLATALSGTTASSSTQSTSSTTSASDIFSQLDSNGDGKITKDELTTSLKKLADSLDDQFNQSRMQGGMPPPPPTDSSATSDSGFTKDQLSAQLSSIGSTDSARSALISKVVANFSQADTNQDGKVSFAEAMAFDQSTKTSTSSSASSSSSSSTDSGTSDTTKSDAQVFRQLMELLRTYGNDNSSQATTSALSSLISVSA
jgi:Ca2+-binding EF-hand superfamily protein